ncbi:MAG: dihydrodipicolinate synthase family protein [Actinomycetota bacterium]|nr:dihydrodipicolinate synthase family protein [Actinomycetota bacterium]
MTLRGVWATALVPWTPEDAVDLARLRDQLDVLAASGVDGIYAHGTAGEFHSLSAVEHRVVSELVAEVCQKAGLPFQIGANHMSAQTVLERALVAAELHPVAIQVTLPDWLPLSMDEVLRFLEAVSDATAPVPLVLYNPPHAKTVLTPEQLGAVAARIPALEGVKVAGGDDEWYARMRTHCDSTALFVPGHHLASGYHRGAAGSYSNVAALSPAGAARWWRLIQEDLAAAEEVETAIRSFFDDHIVPLQVAGYGPPALDKALAHIGGWCGTGTTVRWPASSVPPEHAEQLRAEARQRMPLLFD